MKSESSPESAEHPTASWQPLVSLAICIHLFFVVIAMVSSYGRSELSARVLDKFGFYTQFLNLDLNLNTAPYYLTHAAESDVDHRIELLLENDDSWSSLKPRRFAGAESYRRFQRLGRYWGLMSEDASRSAVLARGIAEHTLQQRDVPIRRIRVRRHLLQDWQVADEGTADERDPDSDLYFRTPYMVDCIADAQGRVDVVKVESTSQVALPGDQRTPSETP